MPNILFIQFILSGKGSSFSVFAEGPLKEAANAQHWQEWGSRSGEKSLLVSPLVEPHSPLERTALSVVSVPQASFGELV